MRCLMLFWAPLFALGCGGSGESTDLFCLLQGECDVDVDLGWGSPLGDDGCALSVDVPRRLQFPSLELLGDASTILPLTVTNQSGCGINIYDVEVAEDSTGAFTVGDVHSPYLGNRKATDIPILFAPQAFGQVEGRVRILAGTSNEDEQLQWFSTIVQGFSHAPQLTVRYDTNPFFAIVGCTVARTIQLENTGDRPLDITSIHLTDSAWRVASLDMISPQFVLHAGTTVDVTVRYTPLDAGVDPIVVEVFSNDPKRQEGLSIDFSGEAVFWAEQIDRFDAAEIPDGRVVLSQVPVLETISVVVGAWEIGDTLWSYDPQSNEVIISGVAPEQSVVVQYAVQSACN